MHSGHELSPSSDFFSDFIYAQEGTKQKAAFFYRQNEIVNIIRKQIKQRQDSLTQYEQAGRAELADTERQEINILENYLPQPLSEDEINEAVASAIK